MADRNRNQMPLNLRTRILNMVTVSEAEREATLVVFVLFLTLINCSFVSKPPGGLDNNGHSRMDEGSFLVCVIFVSVMLSISNFVVATLLLGIPYSL